MNNFFYLLCIRWDTHSSHSHTQWKEIQKNVTIAKFYLDPCPHLTHMAISVNKLSFKKSQLLDNWGAIVFHSLKFPKPIIELIQILMWK